MDIESVLVVSYLPSLLMNVINQASVYLKGNKLQIERERVSRATYNKTSQTYRPKATIIDSRENFTFLTTTTRFFAP